MGTHTSNQSLCLHPGLDFSSSDSLTNFPFYSAVVSLIHPFTYGRTHPPINPLIHIQPPKNPFIHPRPCCSSTVCTFSLSHSPTCHFPPTSPPTPRLPSYPLIVPHPPYAAPPCPLLGRTASGCTRWVTSRGAAPRGGRRAAPRRPCPGWGASIPRRSEWAGREG